MHIKPLKKFIIITLSIIAFSCGRENLKDSQDYQRLYDFFQDYKSDNWEKRREAVVRISETGSKKSVKDIDDFLCEATYDEHPAVRMEALTGLKKRRPTSCLERIRSITQTDPNQNVVLYAYTALSEYRDPESSAQFVAGLESSDWMIREASIKGLMKIRNRNEKLKYTQQIIKVLNDRNESVKIAALSSLSVKDSSLYQNIITNLNEKNVKKVTLLKAALKAVRGYNIDQKTRIFLIELLSHENAEIRVLALRALKKDSRLKNLENIPN